MGIRGTLLTFGIFIVSVSLVHADIYRWDNGQVLPGTEGITPVFEHPGRTALVHQPAEALGREVRDPTCGGGAHECHLDFCKALTHQLF